MGMKNVFLLGLTMSFLLSNAHAASVFNDLCGKTPGHWHGIYTLKNQTDCNLYNGCTHLVMADVTHLSNDQYHVSLNPAVGEGGEFNISCENGVITSPLPGSKVTTSCNATNHCYVLYDDARLTSEMMKG